jgi:2-polyprenyl-6-hydroxyphenyl methylase/3-demethylubiquinone-9 3-methyltransferase
MERFPKLGVKLASCYDEPGELNLGVFDLVISNDVIEHLYAPRKLVSFAKAHLTPGGRVITCTPDFGSYWKNVAYSMANRWDLVHSPLWDGGHIKFFSSKSLRRLFEEGGFGEFSWDNVRNTNFLFNMSIVCICSLNKQ